MVTAGFNYTPSRGLDRPEPGYYAVLQTFESWEDFVARVEAARRYNDNRVSTFGKPSPVHEYFLKVAVPEVKQRGTAEKEQRAARGKKAENKQIIVPKVPSAAPKGGNGGGLGKLKAMMSTISFGPQPSRPGFDDDDEDDLSVNLDKVTANKMAGAPAPAPG